MEEEEECESSSNCTRRRSSRSSQRTMKTIMNAVRRDSLCSDEEDELDEPVKTETIDLENIIVESFFKVNTPKKYLPRKIEWQ